MARVGGRFAATLGLLLLAACDSGGSEPPVESPEPSQAIEFELLQWRCRHDSASAGQQAIRADGEFCFAALNVTNTGSTGASLDASCQLMIDGERRYTPHLEVMALDETAVAAFGEEIEAGSSVENTALYYDVPKGTRPDALRLHEACGDPGVLLPLDPALRSDRI